MASVELSPHQIKAVRELHNGSILWAGVGVGKSRTAIAYFFIKECKGSIKINGVGETKAMEEPKDLYIVTTAKKRDSLDWEKECAPFGLSTARSASFSKVQVTVISWNQITDVEDYTDAFFIFDEQRLVGSGAWVKAFLKIAKNNRWIMLSATPGDNWMDYVPVFIANGFYKNRTEFVRRHVVFSRFSKFPKVERYVEQGQLLNYRNRLLVEVPYDRHTTRHIRKVLVDYADDIFKRVWKDRWHVYEERPLKDVGEMFQVGRKVVNSDHSRIEAVLELMEKHPKLIIFYNFNYELDMLRLLAGTFYQDEPVTVAEWNGQKHEPIPDGDKWLYLVQYTAGAEGWNCIETDATIFFSLNYSYKINEQAKGRIDRLNTPYKDLYYYILQSNAEIDKAIAKSIKEKKNFNEKDFTRSWNSNSHNESTSSPISQGILYRAA